MAKTSITTKRYGYARVSKEHQNLFSQIDALNTFGVDEIVTEKQSGVKRRSELEHLLKNLKTGDTLVVFRLDRLGRTALELLNMSEDFTAKGINFVSLHEKFDTTTPVGRLTFNFMCAIAQMERDTLIERTNAGLSAARKRGRVGGRPRISEQSLKRALHLYQDGTNTVREICKVTNISRSSFYNYLKKERELKKDTYT